MSIAFKLTGFDDLFNETTTPKFIINDHDGTDMEVNEHINNLLLSNIVSEDLSLIPSCMCGETKGAYYHGEICPNPKCGTPVTSVIDDKLTFLVWWRQPKGVARLITPFFYNILLNRYKISSPSVQLVDYLTQTNMRITGRNLRNYWKIEKLDFMLKNKGISRGYNNFVANFMEIIEILEMNFATSSRKADKIKFLEWVREHKDEFFSGYIPIPNRSLFVLDKGDGASYVDKETTEIVNSIRRVTGIDIRGFTPAAIQNRTARTISELAKYYKAYFENNVFKKPGIIRKHITRTRSHFTIRAVVTSLTTPHIHNELQIPWTAACSIFREHIISRLMALGMTYKETINYFMDHLNKYSDKINDVFLRIMSEANGRFPCFLNRNPSLHRGSWLSCFISKVKTEPDDNTLSVSYLLSPVLNMDFDGDMLHVTLLFTQESIKQAENFELHHNVLGLRAPNDFSSAPSLPKSNIGTLSNWLYTEPL